MPLPVTTPHVALVSVGYHNAYSPVQCENTFYVEDNTDAIFDDFPGFALQVHGAFVAQLIPHLYPEVVFDRVTVEDQRHNPFAGMDFTYAPSAGTKGAVSTAMPTSSCFAVKKLTSTPGRAGRGRWYWPLWDASDLLFGDAVSAAKATELTTALAAFQAGVQAGTYPCLMGVVSKVTLGAPRAFGEFTQINAWAYSDLNADCQRRRLLGRGP